MSEAREMLSVERELAAIADEVAESPEEFDAVAIALETGSADDFPNRLREGPLFQRVAPYLGDEGLSPLDGLELGVAGLVYALSAVHCWPAASCRGHPGPRSWSDTPVVLFAANEYRAKAMVPHVEASGCGFGIDPARPLLLAVEAPSIAETMLLGTLILEHRHDFVQHRVPRTGTGGPDGQLTLPGLVIPGS